MTNKGVVHRKGPFGINTKNTYDISHILLLQIVSTVCRYLSLRSIGNHLIVLFTFYAFSSVCTCPVTSQLPSAFGTNVSGSMCTLFSPTFFHAVMFTFTTLIMAAAGPHVGVDVASIKRTKMNTYMYVDENENRIFNMKTDHV